MEFNVESPFSFDLGDDLFPLPTLSFTDNNNNNISVIPQLPSIPTTLVHNNDNSTVCQKPKNGRRQKSPAASTSDDHGGESPNEHKKKKIIHRDVERQRRQEMSSLYSNLRSLIPHEYLKGKRSICDHMQEAVKYIGYMQKKIKELSEKRDDLIRSTSAGDGAAMVAVTHNSSKKDTVILVRPTNGGAGGGVHFQVVVNTATHHRLPVSTILQALIDDGLEILSCISTKINHRFIHTIQAHAVVNPTINLAQLQLKLTNLVYTPLLD